MIHNSRMLVALLAILGIATLLAFLKCPALSGKDNFCLPLSDDYSDLTLTTVSSFIITTVTSITIARSVVAFI